MCVCFGFVMCGCFGNMCTCIYCVLYCLYCVFVLFLLCILFVLSVLVQGLLPPSENSIAVIITTNHVSSVYSVAAILQFQFKLQVMLLGMLNMFCTFVLVLSVVRVQCLMWLFCVVTAYCHHQH